MLEDLSPFWFAFLCSLVASFGTFLGGFAAFFPETSNVSHSNAAASGVMLMLCFLDLVPEALRHLSTASVGFCFVCGFVLFVLLQHRLELPTKTRRNCCSYKKKQECFLPCPFRSTAMAKSRFEEESECSLLQ